MAPTWAIPALFLFQCFSVFGPICFDVHFNVGNSQQKCIITILYAKHTKLISISRPTVIKNSDLVTCRNSDLGPVEKSIQEVWLNY